MRKCTLRTWTVSMIVCCLYGGIDSGCFSFCCCCRILLLIEYEQSAEEEEKSMTRQISKGTCTFCHRELSKASMIRHLEFCEQRTAVQGEIESRQKAKKIKEQE